MGIFEEEAYKGVFCSKNSKCDKSNHEISRLGKGQNLKIVDPACFLILIFQICLLYTVLIFRYRRNSINNRVTGKTRKALIRSGYEPCKNCNL